MSWLEEMFSFGKGGGAKPAPLSPAFSGMSPTDLARARRLGAGGIDTMEGGLLSKLPTAGSGGGMFNSGEGFWGTMLGSKGTDGIEREGWGGMALGIGQGLFSGYQGMQQYGLAKDAFEESQRQYDQNYAAQRQITNSDLEDRQRARVASNPGAYVSVSEYMAKNGIK